MAPGLPPPSPRHLRDPSAGRAGEGDGAWATPSSPANGVTFQRRRFAPRRGEIEEPGDSSTASAVRLGSAPCTATRSGGRSYRLTWLGLAAAVAAADEMLALAGRGGLASGPLAHPSRVGACLVCPREFRRAVSPRRAQGRPFVRGRTRPRFVVTTVWLWLYLIVSRAVLWGTIELLGPAVLWVPRSLRSGDPATARRIARYRAWYRRPVVLIGDREGTDRVLRRILRHPEWGLDVVAGCASRRGTLSWTASRGACQLLGDDRSCAREASPAASRPWPVTGHRSRDLDGHLSEPERAN